jgi:hypothetical protein
MHRPTPTETLTFAFTLGLILFFAITPPLFAHFPENQVYKIFQFPDDHIPAMDGDLSDWDIVPDEYFFDYTYYAEMHRDNSAIDTTDHHVKRVAVGWNDAQNRLYFMSEVYDDVYRFEKPQAHLDSLDTPHSRMTGAFVHGSDIWEILVDGDHGGEKIVGFDRENPPNELRHRSAYVQNYHFYMPPLNGYYWHWLWGKSLWTKEESYSGVGWHYDGKHMSSGTATYECYVTPFDALNQDWAELSDPHDLMEDAVIGLSWSFLDADDKDNDYDAFWSFNRQGQICCDGAFLADFKLMPIEDELFDKE